MKKLQKIVSLLLCACMLLGAAALAEDAQPSAAEALADDTVLAAVNGENVTWGQTKSIYASYEAQYGNYYDMSQESNVQLFRAVAMENKLTEVLMMQKAKEFGLDQLTDEEIATVEGNASSDWEAALNNYISYFHSDLTDESSDEDKAAARADAVNYYTGLGYTAESLSEDYKRYAVLDKLQAMMVQDATVTDQEIEDAYQKQLATDKDLYKNDLAAYVEYSSYVEQMAMYAAMYGSESGLEAPWYKPAGFRAVKHILLPVDQALMDAYTDLQARYEEQQQEQDDEAAEPEATAEPEAEATVEPTPEPVTEDQVNEAKAAIFASLADTIDEINQKIAEGADFDELIATYGVKADGTASDPGMTSEPYKTSGYEVCALSSNYVPEFVEAAMSIESVGGVSAPYLSNYGVHIVKYIADVPGGPIEMTDAQRTAKRESLLQTRQDELYTTTLEKWMAEAEITYSGVTPSIGELEAAQAEEAGEAGEAEAEPEATAEPAAEPEASQEPEATAEPAA